MIKKLIKISLVLVILFWIGVYLLVMFGLSPIVSKTVAKLGPKVIGCEVKVEQTSVNPLLNGVTVSGIIVGNPEGFKTENAFKLKEFSTTIELTSLLSDEIVVREVVVDGAEITYEVGLKTDNLRTIQANLEKFLAETMPSKEGEEPKEQDEAQETMSKKVVIEDFYFRNAKVKLSAKMLGGMGMTIPMKDMHLEDVGKDSEGASLGTVVKELYNKIIQSTASVISGAGGGLKKAGKSIMEGTKSILSGAGDIVTGGKKGEDSSEKDEDGKDEKEESLLDKIF